MSDLSSRSHENPGSRRGLGFKRLVDLMSGFPSNIKIVLGVAPAVTLLVSVFSNSERIRDNLYDFFSPVRFGIGSSIVGIIEDGNREALLFALDKDGAKIARNCVLQVSANSRIVRSNPFDVWSGHVPKLSVRVPYIDLNRQPKFSASVVCDNVAAMAPIVFHLPGPNDHSGDLPVATTATPELLEFLPPPTQSGSDTVPESGPSRRND
ncbi:hypothetical protein [Bradyrhizobium guangdongense]